MTPCQVTSQSFTFPKVSGASHSLYPVTAWKARSSTYNGYQPEGCLISCWVFFMCVVFFSTESVCLLAFTVHCH